MGQTVNFDSKKNQNTKPIGVPKSKISLKAYLRDTMTWSNFENLYLSMGISKTKATQLINSPESMELHHIAKLSQLLGESERSLVDRFNCGAEKLTISEFQLIENRG